MTSRLLNAQELLAENAELSARLAEAEETLRAIRSGEVEALIVETEQGPQIFSLASADAASNRLRGEILAQVNDAVIAVDSEQHITFLNDAAERQYAVTAAEALGRRVSEIFTTIWSSPEDETAATTALCERGEWRGEMVHRMRDSREFDVESSLTVLRDSHGSVVGMVSTIRDISERKAVQDRLRNSEARFRQLADAMPQIVWSNDPAGRVNYLNQRWLEYSGLTVEDSLRDPNVIIHPDDRDNIEAVWTSYLLHSQPFEYEVRLRRHDGVYRWHLAHCLPIRDAEGSITGWYGTSTDIDVHKRSELDARFLANLSQHFSRSDDPEMLLDTATRAIALHLGVSRCLLFEVDLAAHVGYVRHDYHAEGFASLVGMQRLSGYNPEDLDDFMNGHILRREDVKSHPRTANLYERGYAPMGIQATVAIPLMRNGQWVASLWVSQHDECQWSDAEVELLRTAADRLWLAFENARLQAETRVLNSTLEARVAEQTAELRKLSAYIERTREEERTRIAREVHDQLGGALTALKMSLAQSAKGRANDIDLMDKVEDMSGQINGLIQTVRRVASDLRPPLLDDFGLVAALEWQVRDWEKRTGITCQLDVLPDPAEVKFDRDRRTAVFRVLLNGHKSFL